MKSLFNKSRFVDILLVCLVFLILAFKNPFNEKVQPLIDEFNSQPEIYELKTALKAHVIDELVPALRAALTTALPTQPISVEVSDDAEKLWVFYPSAVENIDSYVRPSILIEFGGRNSTLPQSTLAITPDIAEHVLC